MSNTSRGFTLIELLVVIAIIGILSSVVLASLNTARSKGNDAAIQSNLDTIRTQAAIYRDDANVYGTNVAFESDCAAVDNMFSDSNIARAVSAADAANGPTGTVTCNVSAGGDAYVVSAQLVTDTTTYWCVDSVSVGKILSAPLGATDTACP